MSKGENLSVNLKRKISWFFTNGKCCLCSPKIDYYEQDGFIYEFAHIIVLCPTCHIKIDKESEKYPTKYLR